MLRCFLLPQCRKCHTQVHVPSLGGECEHQTLLDATDAADDGDDTVVDQQHVAEERHHQEAFDGYVNAL